MRLARGAKVPGGWQIATLLGGPSVPQINGAYNNALEPARSTQTAPRPRGSTQCYLCSEADGRRKFEVRAVSRSGWRSGGIFLVSSAMSLWRSRKHRLLCGSRHRVSRLGPAVRSDEVRRKVSFMGWAGSNRQTDNNGLEQTGRAGVARHPLEPVVRVAPCSSTQCCTDRVMDRLLGGASTLSGRGSVLWPDK